MLILSIHNQLHNCIFASAVSTIEYHNANCYLFTISLMLFNASTSNIRIKDFCKVFPTILFFFSYTCSYWLPNQEWHCKE